MSYDHAHHSDHAHHVIPSRTYYVIFAVLMALLVLTWAAAQVDFGPLNIPIALGIAATKTLLIMAWFMHLKYMVPLVRLFAVAGFVWLAIGAMFTFADYLTRGWYSDRTLGTQGNAVAPALDRVAPGAERGIFEIRAPGQHPQDPFDADE